jgi:hypothetical protein
MYELLHYGKQGIHVILTSCLTIHILLLQFPLLLQCCQLSPLFFPLKELLSLQLLLLNLLAVLSCFLIFLFLRLQTENKVLPTSI